MKSIIVIAALLTAKTVYSQDRELLWEKKPEKGSKVFIEIDSNGDDCVYRHLSHKLKKVGYWPEVSTKDSADFTIELVMNKRGSKGYIILKAKDGTVLSQSRKWNPGSHPHNGHNACRGIAGRIITWSRIE